MAELRRFLLRMYTFLRPTRAERELSREVAAHLRLLEEHYIRGGMMADEAHRAARRAFGGVDQMKEQSRDVRSVVWLEDVRRDLWIAMRMLRKAPGFAAVAILTLALGIGATSAIFSVVNGVLLKPLPYEDPDELVGIWYRMGTARVPVSPAQYFTYRDENRVFEDIGFYYPGQVSVTGLAEPERLDAMSLTAGLLPLLRVQPVIGRGFTEEDDSPGAPPTIMLSAAYWRRQFGADPTVVGHTLRVDGTLRDIIGVVPSAFVPPPNFGGSPWEPAVYIPFQWDRVVAVRDGNSYLAVARLLPGATIEQASADVERMVPISAEQFPAGMFTLAVIERSQVGAFTRALKQEFVGDIGNLLWILLGSVGIVLVIACANVANLFLVRAEGRHQEVAVRTALGAGRGQIVRQFLVESLVLGLMGGLAGLGLAFGGVRLLTWMGPETLPRMGEIMLDPAVLTFTLGISLLAGLLFGLFPVFRVGGLDLVSSLKEGGRGGSSGTARHRARHTLVVGQMALALVLLAGSGLMIRSFQALRDVDPGFSNPEEVLTFGVAIPEAEIAIDDEAEFIVAFENIWRRLGEIPGVTSVGASNQPILSARGPYSGVYFEDFPILPDEPAPFSAHRYVTGDYSATMQNPVLVGRPIEWSDIHAQAPVAVVTANFAEEYWGSPVAALGKRISTTRANPTWLEIVGVVGDVREAGVSRPAPPLIFRPLTQPVFGGAPYRFPMSFAVRTTSHLGEVTIELASAEARAFTSEALGNRWRETTGPIPEAVEVNFSASAMNPGEDVNVMFSGPDIDDARGTLGGRWGRTRGA